MERNILEIRHLSKTFGLRRRFLDPAGKTVKAVNDVSLNVAKGETFGLVGESGCGKSTLARLIICLLPADEGEVWFEGQDLLRANRAKRRTVRRDMQMIFQKPYESLNPRMTVRDIVSAPLEIHKIARGAEREKRVRELLDLVGLGASALEKYPHEFSGGQRQRIGIARAIALNPKLILCDEPVSALDVSIQAQILNLLSDLQGELGLTYVFISHNLSVVNHVSDTIAVMYAGRIVELADAQSLYAGPLHPYTRTLLDAIPTMDARRRTGAPELSDCETINAKACGGCEFIGRCAHECDMCRREAPRLRMSGEGHWVACHLCATDENASSSEVSL